MENNNIDKEIAVKKQALENEISRKNTIEVSLAHLNQQIAKMEEEYRKNWSSLMEKRLNLQSALASAEQFIANTEKFINNYQTN